MSTSRINDFFKRHEFTLKAAGICAALAGGGTLLINDSFRNNVFNFGGVIDNRQWHWHTYFFHTPPSPAQPLVDNSDDARVHQPRPDAAEARDKRDDLAEIKLAAQAAQEKLRKLEHRERIRARIQGANPDLQTTSVAPD